MENMENNSSSRSTSTNSSSSSSSSDSDISSNSSSSSSSSSSSISSIDSQKKNKRKRKSKGSTSWDNEVKSKKIKRSIMKIHKIKKKKRRNVVVTEPQVKPDAAVEKESTDIPISLMDKPKSLAPMTKEEWEKQQSKVKKVFDESTGRHRLIKGDGEVLEEIVSHERHKAINKQATKGDENYFQSKVTAGLLKK